MSEKDRNLQSVKAAAARRKFLARSAAAGIGTLAAPAIVRGRNLNDKLNLAIIGAGGHGEENLKVVEAENIVILCDVNEEGINKAAVRHPQARKIADFRRSWEKYKNSKVTPNGYTHHEFSVGFSAHRVRATTNRDCQATVTFIYN